MIDYSFLPTKANLLRLKKEVLIIKEGCDLLERKREVLIHELLRVAFELKDTREKLDTLLRTMYDKFDLSRRKMGHRRMRFLEMLKAGSIELTAVEKSIRGVHAPVISMVEDLKLPYQFPSLSCKEFDEFIQSLHALVPLLVRYAEIYLALISISREILKTQKRIRALENVHIPFYRGKISFIEDMLEQSEREDLFRAKFIKERSGG